MAISPWIAVALALPVLVLGEALVVPITGTFLIDLFNATNITVFINIFK